MTIECIIAGVVCLFTGFLLGVLTESNSRDRVLYKDSGGHSEMELMTMANSELLRRITELEEDKHEDHAILPINATDEQAD